MAEKKQKVAAKDKYSGDQFAVIIIIVVFLIPTLFIAMHYLTFPFAFFLGVLPIPKQIAMGLSSLVGLGFGVGGTYFIIKRIWPKKCTLDTRPNE